MNCKINSALMWLLVWVKQMAESSALLCISGSESHIRVYPGGSVPSSLVCGEWMSPADFIVLLAAKLHLRVCPGGPHPSNPLSEPKG